MNERVYNGIFYILFIIKYLSNNHISKNQKKIDFLSKETL
jgi:hypothetical protein